MYKRKPDIKLDHRLITFYFSKRLEKDTATLQS